MYISEIILEQHLNIMLSLGNVCGAVALSMLFSGIGSRRQKILFFLELCASLLLISDRFIWLFEGDTSSKGWWMTRINAFLCYETTTLLFLDFNLYLRELFIAGIDPKLRLKRIRFNTILLIAGTLLIFVFQFTDLYYYFDATNTYREGLLYPLFTFLPFVTLVIDVSLIIQYYKKLERNTRISLLVFAIIPVFDPLVQLLLPGADTTNISFAVMALVLYSIDLMNTKKAAEATIRAIAMSDAKSTFLSNMSHEIRTPLNSVLGMNEMVLRECDDPKILGYSESIKSAGTTLLGLINDILDFSKIEAGKLEIIPVDYDISSLISDLVNMIRPRAEKKGLELITEIDEGIPKLLHGDEIRIKQIITNILTNAVKYTERGSVTFHVGFEPAEEPDDINLLVFVKDTGIGMKEEDMKRLFVQFERIDEKRNRNIEGTGLGMSITRNLLEMMGSAIEVESKPGEGSTFSFRLKQKVMNKEPIGDYAAAYRDYLSKHEKFAEKIYAPDARILVVDDTPMNLKVIKNLIKLTQIQTDTADSGAQCLEKTQAAKYDLILMDHLMPEMDGIETLEQIKSRPDDKNHETPVICLTANAVSGARSQYISAGFSDCLTKPVDYAKLQEALIRYLPQDKISFDRPEEQAPETPAETPEKTQEKTPEETAPEMPPELVLLNQNAGIDVASGIKHCGSVDAYLMVLHVFHDDMEEKVRDLEKFYAAGDLKNYTIKAHATKSSLRIIGANELGEEALRLENAGKSGDIAYIDAHQKEFLNALEPIRNLVASVLSNIDRQ